MALVFSAEVTQGYIMTFMALDMFAFKTSSSIKKKKVLNYICFITSLEKYNPGWMVSIFPSDFKKKLKYFGEPLKV